MEPQVTQNPEPLNNPQNIPPDSIPENPKLKLNIKRLLFLITIIILLAISSVAAFSIYKNLTDNSDNQIACTMDAKICPDGSAVGRSGPNCEFAPCPTTTSSDSSLNGYHGDEYTFDYPDKWIKVENKDLIESFDDFLFFQNQTQAEEFKECNKPDNFPNDCGVIAKIGLISNTVNSDPSHPNIQTYIDTTGKEWGIRIDEADGNWYFKTIIDDENVLSITISMLRYSKAAGFPSNTAGKTAYGSAFDAVKMILSTFKFTDTNTTPLAPRVTYTPTPNPTANWKTHESPLFSIKYPSNWVVPNNYRDTYVSLKSPDYQDDSGLPTITKGFRVSFSVNENCNDIFQNSEGPPYQSFDTTNWLSKNTTIYKRNVVNITSYEMVSGTKSPDACFTVSFPSSSASQGYSANKKQLMEVANTLVIK